MFAYCLNNPIAFVDLFGYHASYCFVHCDSEGGGGYITDQNDPAVAYKRFGLATISHSGCGIIASYNALISMGNRKEFDEVLAYYNSEISNILGYGLTGLLPSDVGSFFNYLGYTTVITMSPTAIKYLSKKADACIMYYMFPRTYSLGALSIDAFGAHFVEYSRLGNQYIARNTGGRNGTSSFSDPFAYGEQGSRYCVVGIFIFK